MSKRNKQPTSETTGVVNQKAEQVPEHPQWDEEEPSMFYFLFPKLTNQTEPDGTISLEHSMSSTGGFSRVFRLFVKR